MTTTAVKIAVVVSTARRRRVLDSLGTTPCDPADTVQDLEAVVVALADQLDAMRKVAFEPSSLLKGVSKHEIVGTYWSRDSSHGGSWRFSRQELSGPPGVPVISLVDAALLNEARQRTTEAKSELSAARRANELLREETNGVRQENAELRDEIKRARTGADARSVHDIRMGKLHTLPDSIKSIQIDRDTSTVVIEEELTLAASDRSIIQNVDMEFELCAKMVGDRWFVYNWTVEKDEHKAHAAWTARLEQSLAQLDRHNESRPRRRLRSEPGRVTSEENRPSRSVGPRPSGGAW